MLHKVQKMISIFIVLFAFLLQSAVLPAATVSMDELKRMFKEKTGEAWNDSTSKKRQDFMNDLHGSKKKKARKKRVEGVTTPYYIVEGRILITLTGMILLWLFTIDSTISFQGQILRSEPITIPAIIATVRS